MDRIGTISCPDTVASEAVSLLVERLKEQGFSPEISGGEGSAETPPEMPDVAPEAEDEAMPDPEAEEANVGAETPQTAEETAEEDLPEDDILEDAETEEDSDAGEDDDEDAERDSVTNTDDTHLTVSISRDKLPDDALARLQIMVSNKEVLFKRALLADALPIELSEDKVFFPWFTLTGIDGEAAAYAQFVTHLCKMAVEQTRVLDTPYDGDNDRFAMRIFMVRLGMKGAQFALARKLMMQNLTGNSGWRYGAPPKKTEETPVAHTEETEEAPFSDTEASEDLANDTPSDTEAASEPESLAADASSDMEDADETEAAAAEEPEVPILDTPSNTGTAEEIEAPEETSDTPSENISLDDDSVSVKEFPDSIEATPDADAVPADVAGEED